MRNKYLYILQSTFAFILMAMTAVSCKSDETYAEQKKKERAAINSFLERDVCIFNEGDTLIHVGRISVISEDQFLAQDSTTDLSRNEYVLFGNTGVYMQIVRKGVGGKLESGQSKQVIARYLEFNIMGDSIQSRNDILYFSTTPDVLDIANSYGTFTATFNTNNGGGAMYRLYMSTEVPAGWLLPFTYIHIGRQIYENDEIAKVRLIVPHSQGTSRARQSVYPCFYQITFQETRK